MQTRVAMLLLFLSASTPGRIAAQESPVQLTRGERQCQARFAASLTNLAGRAAQCFVDCRTLPSRQCDGYYEYDAITRDCLDRALATAQVGVLPSCAGAPCPECYFGGECQDYAASRFDRAVDRLGEAVRLVYCDDAASPDALTAAEARCQRTVVRAGGRLLDGVARCIERCKRQVVRGNATDEACDLDAVDTPQFDARTQRCVDAARTRYADQCGDGCEDQPECFGLSCSASGAFLEGDVLQLRRVAYCEEPGICGDGAVTGDERCDETGEPTGCAGDEACESCSYCEKRCGNYRIDPGEACDGTAYPSQGCGPTTRCNDACTACEPFAFTAVENLSPCNSGAFDTWRFSAGTGTVQLRVDTVDVVTATPLSFSGFCTNGQSIFGYGGSFPCSFSPSFSFPLFCPQTMVALASPATCEVFVFPGSVPCRNPGAAGYRLSATLPGLALVRDDSASPSGAFLALTGHGS